MLTERIIIAEDEFEGRIDVLLGWWDEQGNPVYRLRPVTFPYTGLGRGWLWEWVDSVRDRYCAELNGDSLWLKDTWGPCEWTIPLNGEYRS